MYWGTPGNACRNQPCDHASCEPAPMAWTAETFGNASLEIACDDRPLLVTDPWLFGTAYFGSWALERAVDARQRARVLAAPFVWISHGHPDHLHLPSAESLDRRSEILLPDHYRPEMRDWFASRGFRTRVLRYKKWTELAPGLRVMCLNNENLDAILVIEAGGALMINKNDSPFFGEDPLFLPPVGRDDKTLLLSLCALHAHRLHTYHTDMPPAMGPPHGGQP